MLWRKIDSRKLLIAFLAVIVITITTFIYATSFDDNLIEQVRTKYKGGYTSSEAKTGDDSIDQVVSDTLPVGNPDSKPTRIVKLGDFNPQDQIVLFPKNFPAEDEHLSAIFNQIEQSKLMSNPKVIRYNNVDRKDVNRKSDALQFTEYSQNAFHNHMFTTFNSHKNIDQDKQRCKEIENTFEVEVTEKTSMDGNIEDIVQRFLDGKSLVYEEVKPYFENDIDKQLNENTLKDHWFRLAGTSVWLEQYGVHFMISRLIYSPLGAKSRPAFSLTYTQIFNENWQELTDIELIVPTNDPESIHKQINLNGTFFANIKYPSVIPVPSYHDPSNLHNRYYGPEDPRILLTKNQNGYEEPLVIYNSFHKKMSGSEKIDENHNTLTFDYYRSMFMCFPWQFQRGKRNINELPDEKSDAMIYSRAIELRRKGLDRLPIQKNWTPFTDFKDRQEYNHDKYIYFIYRWSDLEILKCELTGIIGSASNCEFVYRMNDQLANSAPVGALRGGTELININSFVEEYNLQSKISIPDNKEVLIGFARAHLKNCGCGNDIYRPNLVVIVKDLITSQYKIESISSFVSLDVPLIGWDANKPDEICSGGPSVFIPNGISAWSVRDKADDTEGYDDYLTLSFSLTDATVDIIHIKGLLKAVMDRVKYIAVGYNNDNVECALEGSIRFCQALGEETKNN